MSDVRSGSTLLENILYSSNEFVTVGELHNLTNYLIKRKWGGGFNWKCSCGQNFEYCEFWSKIFSSLEDYSLEELFDEKLNTSLNPNEKDNLSTTKAVELINKIYATIFKIYNVDFIVDSSKLPHQGLCLYRNSKCDFKIIHLKRDLRAVAFSKLKWSKKLYNQKIGLLRLLIRSFAYRRKCHAHLDRVDKKDVLILNYEELASNPQKTVNTLAKFVDFKRFQVPNYIGTRPNHSIGGTPNRIKNQRIIFDEKWKKEISQLSLFNLIGFFLNKFS